MLCIVLRVVDKILEQEMIDNDTDSNVILLATTPNDFEKHLDKLKSVVNESFFGRFRIAIDCANPEPVLSLLKSRYCDSSCYLI